MSRLSSVHFSSNYTLSVLHRNSPLAFLNQDYSCDYQHCQYNQYHQSDHRYGAVAEAGGKTSDTAWYSRYYTGEDYQRYAVSYAFIVDLFTQPHQEGCSCSQYQYHYYYRKYALIHYGLIEQAYGKTYGLNQS